MGICCGKTSEGYIEPHNEIEDIHNLNKLRTKSFSDLKDFTFEGKIVLAKVVGIYDGDTVTIVFYDADRPVKYHFRMYGYDSPEMKPRKDIANRELHIKAAHVAKEILSKEIEKSENIVWIKFTKEEKFGRLMGEMYLMENKNNKEFTGKEVCVNKMMIEKGLGKSYQGKAKEEFTLKELQNIIKISPNTQ